MYLDTLELLEYTTGSKDKETLLAKAKSWDPDIVQVMDAVFRFDRKFFIKQMPELNDNPPHVGGHLPQLLALLQKLETRAITGDAAKHAVKTFLNSCTTLERKWFQRIILKDLRCGFGISTCNKAGYKIPEFEVMLAKDGKECKKLDVIISEGVLVSRKYDGYRCLAIVKDGKASLHTRNGKEYENFPTIVAALEKVCPSGNYVFDGEIMSNDFQSMQKSAFASTRGTTIGDVKYHIFDFIPYKEWETQKFETLASERFADLHRFFNNSLNIDKLPLIEVEHYYTKSLDRVLELEREYMAEGYEGAMVLPDIPYYLGRKTNAMMKFKTMQSMDCKVVGIYEGSGKYAGSLGGLHLTQETGESCDCGSGFSDAERDAIFRSPDVVIGRIVEIKYQNLSEDGIMRFPVFVRFRDLGSNSGKI